MRRWLDLMLRRKTNRTACTRANRVLLRQVMKAVTKHLEEKRWSCRVVNAFVVRRTRLGLLALIGGWAAGTTYVPQLILFAIAAEHRWKLRRLGQIATVGPLRRPESTSHMVFTATKAFLDNPATDLQHHFSKPVNVALAQQCIGHIKADEETSVPNYESSFTNEPSPEVDQGQPARLAAIDQKKRGGIFSEILPIEDQIPTITDKELAIQQKGLSFIDKTVDNKELPCSKNADYSYITGADKEIYCLNVSLKGSAGNSLHCPQKGQGQVCEHHNKLIKLFLMWYRFSMKKALCRKVAVINQCRILSYKQMLHFLRTIFCFWRYLARFSRGIRGLIIASDQHAKHTTVASAFVLFAKILQRRYSRSRKMKSVDRWFLKAIAQTALEAWRVLLMKCAYIGVFRRWVSLAEICNRARRIFLTKSFGPWKRWNFLVRDIEQFLQSRMRKQVSVVLRNAMLYWADKIIIHQRVSEKMLSVLCVGQYFRNAGRTQLIENVVNAWRERVAFCRESLDFFSSLHMQRYLCAIRESLKFWRQLTTDSALRYYDILQVYQLRTLKPFFLIWSRVAERSTKLKQLYHRIKSRTSQSSMNKISRSLLRWKFYMHTSAKMVVAVSNLKYRNALSKVVWIWHSWRTYISAIICFRQRCMQLLSKVLFSWQKEHYCTKSRQILSDMKEFFVCIKVRSKERTILDRSFAILSESVLLRRPGTWMACKIQGKTFLEQIQVQKICLLNKCTSRLSSIFLEWRKKWIEAFVSRKASKFLAQAASGRYSIRILFWALNVWTQYFVVRQRQKKKEIGLLHELFEVLVELLAVYGESLLFNLKKKQQTVNSVKDLIAVLYDHRIHLSRMKQISEVQGTLAPRVVPYGSPPSSHLITTLHTKLQSYLGSSLN